MPPIYISYTYQMTIEITAEAKCLVRFEDNTIIDWRSRERERCKKHYPMEGHNEKAIQNKDIA